MRGEAVARVEPSGALQVLCAVCELRSIKGGGCIVIVHGFCLSVAAFDTSHFL